MNGPKRVAHVLLTEDDLLLLLSGRGRLTGVPEEAVPVRVAWFERDCRFWVRYYDERFAPVEECGAIPILDAAVEERP